MAGPLALKLYLATRARSDRGVRRRLSRDLDDGAQALERERLGEASAPRPDGPLVWVHTGRDRHGLAARELAHRMRLEHPELSFLFTTGAQKRRVTEAALPSQLAPADNLPAVRRFLDHWRPDIALWTEADSRPALITETADRNVPLLLVDAHTAPPELQGWRLWRGLTGALLARFGQVITGDATSAAALRRLGAAPGRLQIAGFLEEGTAALPCNRSDCDSLSETLSGRPVWLAANLSDAEIEAVIEAHRQAIRRTHRLLLILLPEDPEAGPDLDRALRGEGFVTGLRSAGAEPEADTQVYIADTDGELGLWYRLAAVSFLGQSLEAGGGINPFEAAALGSAIIHGPNLRNFRRAYGRLGSAGATRMVRNADELAEAVDALLSPDVAATMAHEAWKVCSAGAEVTDRTIELVLAELDARGVL
jgi:3-deoxy-D-manno-octulosonic-acid transferase